MTRVPPRDAASLVLVRSDQDGPAVLMGRRRKTAAFAPDVFVFPGGRLQADDRAVQPARPLRAETVDALCASGRCTPLHAAALAIAAIRETWEETGFAVAAPAARPAPWPGFGADLAPDLSALSFVARAITPAASPIRFHARFFAADASAALGTLAGDGELAELDWYPIARALHLPVIDVTEFVLRHMARRLQADGAAAPGVPLFAYRRNRSVVRAR